MEEIEGEHFIAGFAWHSHLEMTLRSLSQRFTVRFSVDPADSFNDKAGTWKSELRRVSEVLPSRVAVRSFVANLATWARHLLRSGPHHLPRGWLGPMAGTGFKPTCRITTGQDDVTGIIHHVRTRVGSYATPANRVTPEPSSLSSNYPPQELSHPRK